MGEGPVEQGVVPVRQVEDHVVGGRGPDRGRLDPRPVGLGVDVADGDVRGRA